MSWLRRYYFGGPYDGCSSAPDKTEAPFLFRKIGAGPDKVVMVDGSVYEGQKFGIRYEYVGQLPDDELMDRLFERMDG